MLIAFNKPYGVLPQFTSAAGRPTLADFMAVPGVYPAGRLDADSEGLMLLTDDGRLQDAIAGPAHGMSKRYWAQVEGVADPAQLAPFAAGLWVGEGAGRYRARPATARAIEDPGLAPRDPPVRFRAAIPTSWIEVTLAEGRNRQVRRMTAAVGLPTLRLIRMGIGPLDLSTLGLDSGGWKSLDADRLTPMSRQAAPAGRR